MKISSWPIKLILASSHPKCVTILVERLKNKNDLKVTLNEIGYSLAGLTLFRLWQANIYSNLNWDNNPNFAQTKFKTYESIATFEKIIQILEQRRLKIMPKIALREMAMQNIYNLFFSTTNSHKIPIVIKGAATASKYYPDKSFRLSGDIDILVPAETIPLLINNDKLSLKHHHHASPGDCHNDEQISKIGFYIEWHSCFRYNMKWSSYDNLNKNIQPLLSNLQTLDDEHSLLIAASHMFSHFGEMTNDLIDCSFIVLSNNFSWQRVWQLAISYNLQAELLAT
ncbi:MAG: nucleotidyltransferase family protein, partial [Lentisphaeria bacterium]